MEKREERKWNLVSLLILIFMVTRPNFSLLNPTIPCRSNYVCLNLWNKSTEKVSRGKTVLQRTEGSWRLLRHSVSLVTPFLVFSLSSVISTHKSQVILPLSVSALSALLLPFSYTCNSFIPLDLSPLQT